MVPFKAFPVKFLDLAAALGIEFMDQQNVQQCIEKLCQKGCAEVLETINALEQNRAVEETLSLNNEEVQFVLAELKSIMAIYQ